jgi:hypothetical protein
LFIRIGDFSKQEAHMARHSIQLSRASAGWDWRLVDGVGVTTTAGSARSQEAAMLEAWTAARAHSSLGSKDFPEITIGHGPSLDLAA